MKHLFKHRVMFTLLGLIGPLAIAASYTGCVTAPQVVTDPTTGLPHTNTVQVLNPIAIDAIKGTLTLVTPLAVRDDTNAAPYLELVANVFSMASESGVYDPAQIQTALDAVSIKELRNSSAAKQVVTTAMNAYRGIFADAINSKVAATKWGPFAQGLLAGMATGIQNGLKTGS